MRGAKVYRHPRMDGRGQMVGHIALLGDTIFDNGVYTSGEPDVVTHLRSLLPSGWEASLQGQQARVRTNIR